MRRLLIGVTSAILKGVYRLFGGFRVAGLENLPATGAAIIAPNHLSWADPPAIRSVIRRTCWFMANDFLFRVPVLGCLIPLYGAFPVKRGRVDRAALHLAEEHLKKGDLVVIFPEGGTSLSGRLVPFESGVALLAIRNGVPVIPLAITGTDRVLPAARPIPRFARGGVTLRFGPPIQPGEPENQSERRRRIDTLTREIEAAVTAMLPEAYRPEAAPLPEAASLTPAEPPPQ